MTVALIEHIEQQLTQYLAKAWQPGSVQVYALPQTAQEYSQLMAGLSVPRLVVSFKDEQTQPNQSLGLTTQSSSLRFTVLACCSLLRGKQGLYSYLEATRVRLLGWQVNDLGPLSYTGSSPIELMEKSYWQAELYFMIQTIWVQKENT